MTTVDVEDLKLTDELKQIGVTKFYRLNDVLHLVIGERRLRIDIEKKFEATMTNMDRQIEKSGIRKELGARLKLILPTDYEQHFKIVREEGEERGKPAQRALELIQEKCRKLFLNQINVPYAAIEIDDHVEVLQISKSRFKNLIIKTYYDSENNTIGTEVANTVAGILSANADFDATSEVIELFVRVAMQEKDPYTIYYDLTNKNWEVVKITSEGWSVISSKEAPILFERHSNQRAQVYPAKSKDYPPDIMEQFINLLNISKGVTPEGKAAEKSTRLLIKCYIICLLFVLIAKALSITHGEQGAAKSTGQQMVKVLIDPCTAMLLGIPDSKAELIQLVSHNYISYFDNVSYLKDWMIDEICRAVTGSGNQKRRLFTDDEDVVNNFKRCLGFNGINLASARQDMLDRAVINRNGNITDETRRLEEELWSEFEKIRPQVLAYIFDIVVKVLKLKKAGGIKLKKLPRMADFALHCEMISRCMGNEDNAFIDAFAKNVQVQTIESISGDIIATVIIKLMEPNETECPIFWWGTYTELLGDLQAIALVNGINTHQKDWPKAPNRLSNRLNLAKPSLRKIGIDIQEYTIETKTKLKGIRIRKVSPESPESPESEKNNGNRAQITSDKSDNFSGDTLKIKTHGAHSSNQKSNGSDITINIGSAGRTATTQSVKPKSAASATVNDVSAADSEDIKILQWMFSNGLGVDLEFDPTADNRIDAVSFIDGKGNCEVKFRDTDFGGSEPALLDYINIKLLSKEWIFGYNIQGNTSEESDPTITDLYILHKRCLATGTPSIIRLGYKGVPFIKHSEIAVIDLYNIYSKVMVKNGIYNSYRTNGLGVVSQALLGYGKYKNYSGEDFYSLPRDEQEKYSLMDTQLVMDLAQYNKFEALSAMLAVSDITKLDFERVCRTNLTTWWKAVFDEVVPEEERPIKGMFEGTYKGADVIDPKKGLYDDVVVVDGKSLYPSVDINYNISSDTINTCDKCKNDPKGRIGNIFPHEFTKDFKFVNPDKDWICRCPDKKGYFPSALVGFKEERLRQKQLGNRAKQHALKILINGGYGAFGDPDFDYYDPRVAELITAAGRFILSEMQDVAEKEYGFGIIYGDTDSLFLHKTTDKALKEFQNRFNAKYKIELEIKNRYEKLLLSAGKKHYIGIENGKVDIVGFEGKKSDRCKWIHNTFLELIDNILKHKIDPLPALYRAFKDVELDKVDSKLLFMQKRVNQPLDEYEEKDQHYKIAVAGKTKQGELTKPYYYADKKKSSKTWTFDPVEKYPYYYKMRLWNIVKEILDIAGYNLPEQAKNVGVRINLNEKSKNWLEAMPELKTKPMPIRRPKPSSKPKTKVRRSTKNKDSSTRLIQGSIGGDL